MTCDANYNERNIEIIEHNYSSHAINLLAMNFLLALRRLVRDRVSGGHW